jgi:hypothetical protein
MHCWEFHQQGVKDNQRWSWRATNKDGTLHTHSRQAFDSFTKAFENAKSHGFDQAQHHWHLADPADAEAAGTPQWHAAPGTAGSPTEPSPFA